MAIIKHPSRSERHRGVVGYHPNPNVGRLLQPIPAATLGLGVGINHTIRPCCTKARTHPLPYTLYGDACGSFKVLVCVGEVRLQLTVTVP